MEYITDQEEISGDDQGRNKRSLKIVNNKSEQLLNFISNYRQVAELPKPKLQKISIRPVIEKVLRLMESEFQNKNITLSTNIRDYMVMADRKNAGTQSYQSSYKCPACCRGFGQWKNKD